MRLECGEATGALFDTNVRAEIMELPLNVWRLIGLLGLVLVLVALGWAVWES